MPAALVCVPPRHRNACAPCSVTPNEYASWLCRWYRWEAKCACIASTGRSAARQYRVHCTPSIETPRTGVQDPPRGIDGMTAERETCFAFTLDWYRPFPVEWAPSHVRGRSNGNE